MFRVIAETAATAATFGAKSKHARSQPAQGDDFTALVDSNAVAAQDAERANAPASPDAPAARLDGGDTQSKTDNKSETKSGNTTDGKSKPKNAQATDATATNVETGDDAANPELNADAAISPEAVTVVLSSDALKAVIDSSDAVEDVATTDSAEPAISVASTIVADVAVITPAIATNVTADAAAPAEATASVASVETVATNTSSTVSVVGEAASDIDMSANAAIAAQTSVSTPGGAPEAGETKSDAAPAATVAANAKPSATIAVESADASNPEIATALTATAEVGASVAAETKAKPVSAAPASHTQTIRSADAEASVAPPSLTNVLGKPVESAAPQTVEAAPVGQTGQPQVTADKADTVTVDGKTSTSAAPTVTTEHRPQAAVVHAASFDPNLPPLAPMPQQQVQLQTPNLVVAHAAQHDVALANVPVPINGLAIDIALRAAGGSSRFEIRLDPAELGRIDVRLEMDKHGNVTSHLTVEKPATLDMLRRDAPQLQRALEDAGLKTGDSGLQFSLRDQSSSSGRQDDNNTGRNSQRLIISEDDTVPAQIAGKTYGRMLGASGGVDIRV